MGENLDPSDYRLAGRQVLVVVDDDDVRNIFSLTAVLERDKMVVTSAENGRQVPSCGFGCTGRGRHHA